MQNPAFIQIYYLQGVNSNCKYDKSCHNAYFRGIHTIVMFKIQLKVLKCIFLFSIISSLSLRAQAQNNELRSLQDQLKTSKDSLRSMRLMNRIGFLIHLKNADSAFYYGIRARKIADVLHNTRGQADALSNIATGLLLKGLYNQALNYFGKAYLTYKTLPDTIEMSQMLMNSAVAYSFTDDSIQSRAFAIRALNTVKRQLADSSLSFLYTNYVELGGLSN